MLVEFTITFRNTDDNKKVFYIRKAHWTAILAVAKKLMREYGHGATDMNFKFLSHDTEVIL